MKTSEQLGVREPMATKAQKNRLAQLDRILGTCTPILKGLRYPEADDKIHRMEMEIIHQDQA